LDRQVTNRERISSRKATGPDLAEAHLTRRKMFTGAVGVAAAGAAGGGAVLAQASPASAATTEQGAVARAVVNLTDAATIAVDASLGNDFRVTIAGNHTMGTPANPADGQRITFQITQGSGGSFAITWDTGYEFSDGLPKPALSTTAGQTDLLGFIYNAAKGKWLLAAFAAGYSSAAPPPPPPPPPPQGTYRLFASTSGPSAPVSYSGPFMAGVLFKVTTGGMWFDGYWWWVCPTGQSTSPQKFALWAVYNGGAGSLIPAATVTSDALTAGQWNFVPLARPVPLAIGACYNACTGVNGSFPDNQGQFGAGQPYGAGIVNGPLSAFSDQSGSLPAPFNMSQGVFSVAGTDPTALMPANGNQSDNLWMDLQADSTPPAGASYRLWPSYPTLPGTANGGTLGYTLATEFKLSQACALDHIWFYSPSGAAALPTRCAIWNVTTQQVVSGTDSTSPSWSGGTGSGWVSRAYSGVTLPAGDYKVAVFNGGGAAWFLFNTSYWDNGGPGANGITAGPVTAPGNAKATSPGQGSYHEATWAYPNTYGTNGNGENYWVDVEVTPA
jgi:hypothetical protein